VVSKLKVYRDYLIIIGVYIISIGIIGYCLYVYLHLTSFVMPAADDFIFLNTVKDSRMLGEGYLQLSVKRTIENFLGDLWRAGALSGSSEGEAFFVDIGTNTMSQSDIDNGKLICVIGVAPVKPAEFVIFRITQKTNGAV